MGTLSLGVTDAQLRSAAVGQFSGLTAFTTLTRAAARAMSGVPMSPVEREVWLALDDPQRGAVATMIDEHGTFCPSSAIPDHLQGSLGRVDADRVAEADTTRLESMLCAIYPGGVTEGWKRVLEEPRAWTRALAGAYVATQELFLGVWNSHQSRLTSEQVRFEIAMDSGADLGSFLTGCAPFRHEDGAITMPYLSDLSLAFTGTLTFAPLLTPRPSKLLLIRDDGEHATVAWGLGGSAARPAYLPPSSRLQALVGLARAGVLVACGKAVTIGELGSRLVYSPATMTYHVGILESVGLVGTERRNGRVWVKRTIRGDILIETLA